MIKQMILSVAEGTDFDNMPELVQEAIQRAGGTWPEGKMPNTKAFNGKQLVLVSVSVDKETLLQWANVSYQPQAEDAPPVAFNLGWEVLACEGEQVNQATLLPFYLPDVTHNNDGVVISTTPITDLTGRIQTWAGKKWVY